MKNSKHSLLSYELELYKNLYTEENNYRNNFSDRVFKTITVIVSIIGAVIWLIIKFSSIFQTQCCYLQCLDIFLLSVICIVSTIIVFLFFKILYNYRDTRINPVILHDTIEDYKRNNIDENVIELTDRTLINSYVNATIKNYQENTKRIELLRIVYRLILIDIIFISIAFLLFTFL